MYKLFSVPVALMLTIGVVVISFLVSMREKTETTFFIGTLGGYMVPLIAGFYAKDAVSMVQLFWYISALNIGIILVSKYMDWMKSVVVGFICSWLMILSLYGDMGDIGWTVQWLFTTISALTYLIVFVVGDIRQSRTQEHVEASVILTVINTCIYSVVAYYILYPTPVGPYLGFLVALLATIHFVVYGIIQNSTQSFKHPAALTHMVLAVVLLTAAIPMQFDGPLVTMIWFVEGVILSYLATTEAFKGRMLMYVLGMFGILSGIIHMIAFGSYVGVREGYMLIFNQQYLVWLFVIVLTQGIAYIWKASVSDVPEESPFRKNILEGFLFLSFLVQVCFIGLTIREIEDVRYVTQQKIYTEQEVQVNELKSYYGMDSRADTYVLDQYMNGEYDAKIRAVYEESAKRIEESQKNFSFVYIIFFTIMTVIYLLIGLLKENKFIQKMGITMLAITLIQLFNLTWSLGPVFRIASFVGIGVILLIVAYVYVRHNKKNTIPPLAPLGMLILLVSSCISSSTIAAVIEEKDWSHMSTFVTPQVLPSGTTWYVAPLDSSVWLQSKAADFADLRIVDTTKTEIPYLVIKEGGVAKTQGINQYTQTKTKIIENSIRSKNGKSERVLVLDTGKEGQVYTGISFEKNLNAKNFRKAVRVYISDTMLGASSPAWREVEQKNVVYNYTDGLGFIAEDMDISFSNMASRYIKVEFLDDAVLMEGGVSFSNQIQIDNAYMHYDEQKKSIGTQIQNYLSGNFKFTATESDIASQAILKKIDRIVQNTEKKSTELYINDVRAATRITLKVDESDTNFTRDVTVQGSSDAATWNTIATGQIHRIYSPIYVGEKLFLETPVSTYPYVRVIIQNKNDKALAFQDVAYINEQKVGVLFKAENININTLRLLIGNKKAIQPTYEIQKTLPYFNTLIPAQVYVRDIQENPLYVPEKIEKPFGIMYQNALRIVLVVFVLVLGYLGYTWTKKS
jgi:hypothetical protein